MNRRELLQSAGAVFVTPAVTALTADAQQSVATTDDRAAWIGLMRRLADPVLNNLAGGTLRLRMPVEQAAGATNRPSVTHLEAAGRLMAGIGPWLELGADDSEEGRLRARYGELARRAIDKAVDHILIEEAGDPRSKGQRQ